MATIHQRLRDERGLAVSVASLRRYVAANLPEEARRSQVTVLRLVPAEPGAEAQIDYGQLGRWLDPATGRRHVVNAFAMVLCCSRHMFVRPVITMDQHAWTECHVAAFGFFGGVPARLVPDNLKTGVDRPDLYDPKINRSYAELAAHYGCLVDPARSRKPRTRRRSSGRCRISGTRSGGAGSSPACSRCRPRPCGGARRWPGGGRAGRWTAPPRPRCSPRPRKTALTALPVSPFVLAQWSRCKVGPDIHVKVGRTLVLECRGSTSARPWMPGSTATMVQFFARRRTGQDPRPQAAGQADRPGRLPAGEDRVPHAHPGVVPEESRRDRPGLRRR